jgi:hypothetical protein
MPPFDRHFIDPSDEAVAAALSAAAQSANQRQRERLLRPVPSAFRAVVAASRAEPEGVACWAPGSARPLRFIPAAHGTVLLLAWWSDALSRRHVRVAARRHQGDLAASPRLAPVGDDRPPLWLIETERTYLRTRPGRPREAIVACACGAVGTPQALAWMGDCCGPCHDRCEDRALRADQVDWRPLTIPGTEPVCAVAWSASGRTLLVGRHLRSAGWGHVEFVDRDSGQVRRSHRVPSHADAPLFACDGRHVGVDGVPSYGFWDAETGAEVFAAGRPGRGDWMDPNRPTLLVAPGHRALLAVRDYNDRFQQEERVGWSELGGQPPPVVWPSARTGDCWRRAPSTGGFSCATSAALGTRP